MRTLGLSDVRRDKASRTTIAAKDGTRAADLLERDFAAATPNRIWVTDFTYCRIWAGWVSVAFVSMSTPNGSWPGMLRQLEKPSSS